MENGGAGARLYRRFLGEAVPLPFTVKDQRSVCVSYDMMYLYQIQMWHTKPFAMIVLIHPLHWAALGAPVVCTDVLYL